MTRATVRFSVVTMVALGLGVFGPRAAAAQPVRDTSQAPLQSGDAVWVRLAGDSALRDTLRVEADGHIVLAHVGRLFVTGVPATDVPALVRRALATATRSQELVVRPLRRVTVVGEITRPGVFYLELDATVRDAVAAAGAFSTVADGRKITLLRQGAIRTLPQWQLTESGSATIASGDVLAVSREGWLRRNAQTLASSVLLIVTTFVAASR